MVTPEEWAGTLVTEAVRGEGGHLLNASGERFMHRYDPERMELSTRDRVALANYTEIIEGRAGPNGGVFLDISHRPKEFILQKVPRMYRQFLEAQMLDISRDPMEVAPTAHYSMGGVVVEPETHATSVIGLYAAGEVTAGVHGANRLGGNSLAEILVFGRRAALAAAAHAENLGAQLRSKRAINAAHDELDRLTQKGAEIARPLQRAVRDTMWENCGVVRHAERLAAGLNRLHELREAADRVDVRPSSEGYKDLALALDLRGALAAAEATMRCAAERRESRGAHQRYDYPALDPNLRVNFLITLDERGEQVLTSQPAEPVPAELEKWLETPEELSLEKRLLE
jgi:succinate dehydrogenase / fumarate reductase flavoprotein subunit